MFIINYLEIFLSTWMCDYGSYKKYRKESLQINQNFNLVK